MNYSSQSPRGTGLLRTGGFPGTVVGTTQRAFGAAVQDVWSGAYPAWSTQIAVEYPLGTSHAEAARAAARLQRRRGELRLADAELEVRIEVGAAVREPEPACHALMLSATASAAPATSSASLEEMPLSGHGEAADVPKLHGGCFSAPLSSSVNEFSRPCQA